MEMERDEVMEELEQNSMDRVVGEIALGMDITIFQRLTFRHSAF